MTNLMIHALILRKRTHNNNNNYDSKTFKFHFQSRIAKCIIRIKKKTRFTFLLLNESSQGQKY